MRRSGHYYNNSESCDLLVLISCTDSDSYQPDIWFTQQTEFTQFVQVFTYIAYVTPNSDLNSNPEPSKPKGQTVGSLQWVALTQAISHAVILRVFHGGRFQLEIGGRQ